MLPPAQVRLDADGGAYCDAFDDIYYRGDGIDEVNRTFIRPADVVSTARQHGRITVAELGFGTGLNFVVTAATVLRQTSAHLHFISVEQFPVDHDTWQALSHLRGPALPLYTDLARQVPPHLPGWHRRTFAGGRVTLSLFHGDVADALASLHERQTNTVDAWYLDGFAPDRNPDMWAAPLFRTMADCSHTGTRIATFTAASRVRRALREAGFETHTIDQRPYKRESLAARFTGPRERIARVPRHVTVHGAGLGGTAMARQLAEQGIATRLCDPAGIGNGASGIPTTLLHARLLGDRSVTAEHRVNAYHHACAALHGYAGTTTTGALQIAGPNLSRTKLERIVDTYAARSPSQHHWIEQLTPPALRSLGVEADSGLWFPGAQVVRTRALSTALARHPNIEFSRDRHDIDDGGLHILCTGLAVRSLRRYAWLELAEVHGQIDSFWQSSSPVAVPVVGHGYFVPDRQICTVGATYEYTPWTADQASASNRQHNAAYLQPDALWTGRHRAARTVSSDRLPVVGRLADSVWIATAFGSMGTSAAPFAAAQVASELCGWVPPMSPALEQALAPARFAQRQARRGILKKWQPPSA